MNRAAKTSVMQFHCGSRGIYTIHRAIECHGLVRLLTRRKTIGRILITCVLKTGEANLRDIADVEIRMQCGFIGERRGSSVGRCKRHGKGIGNVHLIISTETGHGIPLEPRQHIGRHISLGQAVMRIAIAERLSIEMPLPGTNESVIRLFAKTMAVGKAGPKPREYHRNTAAQRPTFSNHHRRRCKHHIRGLAKRPPAQQMRAVVADGGGTCGIVDVAKHEISHYLSSNIGK